MKSGEDLFGSAPSKKIDRPLIAFAFLAQANAGNGDILAGITPIFKPIARDKAGEVFNPEEFSRIVSELYGISIHPWAIHELASRLEQAGFLNVISHTETTKEYAYAKIEGEFNAVDESDIKLVVQKFIDFSTPILKNNKLPIDVNALEEAFFSQLISMDFVAILKKPDRSKEDKYKKETIRLKPSVDRAQRDEYISAKSKIEVLCASFILEMYRNDKAIYDLLVKIASGAFVAEAVLNFREPENVASLDNLKVILDGPFIMSLLNLGAEETHVYAKKLCQILTEHGAKLYAFQHSCLEIQDNLRAVFASNEAGVGFGSTSRRLSNQTFQAYANSIKINTQSAIEAIGIAIIKPMDKASNFQYFTQDDEDQFRNSLDYYNPTAQYRDAQSIAYTIRLRKGKQLSMTKFYETEYLFVTENPTLAKRTARFLNSRNLIEVNSVPIAITDRYLAGLLLVLYGSKDSDLTHYRLLANCSAALETRNDVINKVSEFLSKMGEEEEIRFRALMTVERASQCLMQFSLGDSVLINDGNIPKIVEEVEKALIEKERLEFESQRKVLTLAYEQEAAVKNNALKELNTKVLDIEADVMQERALKKAALELHEKTKNDLLKSRLINLENDKKRVEQAVIISSRFELVTRMISGLILALMVAFITYLSFIPHFSQHAVYFSALAGILFLSSYIKFHERLMESIFEKVRFKVFLWLIKYFTVSYGLEYFEIDWKKRSVMSLEAKVKTEAEN